MKLIAWTVTSVFAVAAVGSAAFSEPPTTTVAPAQPAATAAAPQAKAANSATTPAPRTDDGWVKRNESFNARAKQAAEKGDIDLLFIGDSITQGWEGAGKGVWEKFYTKRHAANFGIGGDRTQHIIWRAQNGNLEGLAKPKAGAAPKLVVLMIGTNNSNGSDNTAEEIGEGIKGCVAAIHAKLPESKILLLSVFPRGDKPNPQREKNADASRRAAAAADGKMVFHLDIGDKFMEKDGTISKEIMPDYLHLSEKGYQLWADAIEGKVKELMGEK